MWLLRDPLQLTENQLVMPSALAQMLMFCDGTRTAEEIHRDFRQLLGAEIDFAVVTNALEQLDSACLLDNARSRAVQQTILAEYRSHPFRPPALSGLSYPEEPAELHAHLQEYRNGEDLSTFGAWRGRGIISPHIDYQRGGPVYAQVWHRARAAVLDADLVLMFGTDHNGSAGSFTLTRQPYATPYGVIPTDLALIDSVVEAIGPEAAFAEELHHRNEHSVELSAVWMHHICRLADQPPPPMVPILCGSFHQFVASGTHPDSDTTLMQAVETLRRETAGKKVLVVASVDLAHVGPNFGDSFPMDDPRRAALTRSDDGLIQSILTGDAASFYDQVAAVQNSNRICGFSSIYLMLRFLGEVQGTQIAYDHCPADTEDTSLVSICGLLLA